MLKLLVASSLKNRVLVLIAALALCVYGYMAARDLPIDVLPDINRPTVTILTEAHGLAPEEVEAQVTAPIENAVNGAAGVERVRSVSGIGLSIVYVEYAWGSDIYRCRQIVQERMAEVRERLPKEVTPQMGPVASIMGEVMLVGVSSEVVENGDRGEMENPGIRSQSLAHPGREVLSPMQLRDAADWILRPGLLSVPGVASVTVQGGDVKQFQVKADPDKLRLYEVTLGDLERALSEANKNTGGGFLIGSSTELIVRNVGRLRTAEEIASALVTTRTTPESGHSVAVRVRDVAKVVEGPAAGKRGDASVMGKPGVVMAIGKQPGADTRDLTRRLDERLEHLRSTLPKGMVIDADLFRQSHFIEASVGNVEEALRDGAILVVIVLALFLMNVRTTLITLTALPLSILSTFIVFKLLGQSVNTMTLGGIAIATGELVDDAVVGVENIYRRLAENRARATRASTMRVVFDATCEVRGPILVSTAVVLLVFLPLLFLPGLSGKLFTPLAHAYIVSIFASMVVSMTVTPVLAWMMLGRGRAGSKALGRDAQATEETKARGPDAHVTEDGPVLRACKRAALWAYDVSMRRTGAVVGVCIVLVAVGVVATAKMGTEFLPPFNEGSAVVSVTSAPGIALAEANRLGTIAEGIVLGVPEVKRVARRTGRAEQDEHALGVNATELEVDFFKQADVKAKATVGTRTAPAKLRSRREVFKEIREKLGELPGVNVSVGQPIGHRIEHLESGVQAQIVVKIFGPELSQLRGLGESARAQMGALAGVTDLAVEQQVLVPQVRVRVDAERAAVYGFTVAQLVDTLQTAVGGKVVSEVLDGLRTYDLVVMFDDPWLRGSQETAEAGEASLKALGAIRLVSPSGAVALISDVADIQQYFAPNQVARENGLRRIVVSCNVQGQDLGRTAEAIESTLRSGLKLPVGYSVRVEGQFESRQKAVRTIVVLGLVSLAVMFTLLWTHFGSTMMATQVMLNIPFAFIGAVAALVIAREPFSVASLIGFISLCGIAARNGVLMVSHYIHLMTEEGMPFGREMVVRGSQERVAPVLMTALTTGLAMCPILLAPEAPGKEILYPLALVVFGGLVSSTLLDFFVTPAVFLRFAGKASAQVLEASQRAKRGEADELGLRASGGSIV